MTDNNFTFYCDLCNKEFEHATPFSQDLHIRRFHADKIIGDAVKQYTKIVFEDLR